MSSFQPIRSLENKLQNPSSDEPLFERDLYAIKWTNIEIPFFGKFRILAIVQRSGPEFFKRLDQMDSGIDFIDKLNIHTFLNNLEEFKKAIKQAEIDLIGEYQKAVETLILDVLEIQRVSKKVSSLQAQEEIIAFHLIPYLYEKGQEIEVNMGGIPHAAILLDPPSITQFNTGVFLHFRYKVIDVIEKPKWIVREEYIPYYVQTKVISELPVKPLSKEQKEFFIARGKKTLAFALKPSYKLANKHRILIVKASMFSSTVVAQERVRSSRAVIDCVNLAKLGVEIYEEYKKYLSLREVIDTSVNDEYDAAYVISFMVTYIPDVRYWCLTATEDLDEIVFADNAINELVLPDKTKSIVRALVQNSSNGFKDIIQGKSGGTVICLGGPPGVGKTLTAEAVAEFLHKPLLTISSGSLGTNAKDIELRLKRELSIAEEWGAVTLLDESDVFMSKRDSNDIEHNGVVSVFLRCLEYFRGVMFLTTNRRNEIDEAFKSRILLSIQYNDLTPSDRQKIWKNLLKKANIPADAAKLAYFPINGRQIKNAIRISENIDDTLFPKQGIDQTRRIINILNHIHSDELTFKQRMNMIWNKIF